MLLKIVCSLSHFESRLRQLFWSNTKPEIVFFSERSKSWRRKNICLRQNTKFKKKEKFMKKKYQLCFLVKYQKVHRQGFEFYKIVPVMKFLSYCLFTE